MDIIEKKIQELKTQKYQLPVGKILSESFLLFSRIIFLGVFSVLFTLSILILVYQFFTQYFELADLDNKIMGAYMNLISTIAKGDAVQAQTEMLSLTQNATSYINNFCVQQRIIIFILSIIIISPLLSGIIYCAYKKDSTGFTNFKDLIQGFEGKKFFNLIGFTSIYLLLIIISIYFFYLPMLFFAPVLYLARAFIIIHNIPLSKSIKYSFQIAKINFGSILIICIISFLIGTILGQLFSFMFLFAFTIPFSLVMVYVVYKNIMGDIKISND